jgi:hypothetical protein
MFAEALQHSVVQFMIGEAIVLHPMHEVFCRSNVAAGGYLRVPTSEQLFGEVFYQCTGWTTANCADPLRRLEVLGQHGDLPSVDLLPGGRSLLCGALWLRRYSPMLGELHRAGHVTALNFA